jgi:penicillin-binding protein
MAYITHEGVNYVPNPATPSDMVKEKIVIKRKKPLDVLMDEIKAAQSKLSASSRRSLEVYLPADAENNAPSKPDPRTDDGAAPPPPSDVKLQSTDGVLILTFKGSTAADVVGYRVYRSTDQQNYEKHGESIMADSDKRMKLYASASQSNTYYVTAVDVVGKESAPSQLVQYGNVPISPEPPVSPDPGNGTGNGNGTDIVAAAPSAPTNLQAAKTELSVRLTWAANSVSDQVTQYHVYYSSNNDGKYSKIGSTSETSFEYVAPLITGSFYVTSENASGESGPSSKQKVS